MRHGLLHACVRAWMAGGVVVSTSTGHTRGPGSISGQGKHGIFGFKTWLSTLGTV